MTDEVKCKSKLEYLHQTLGYFDYVNSTRNTTLSADYIREFMSTKYCDKYYDISSYRNELSNSIGAESMSRIEQFKETEDDIKRAGAVILLNKRDHNKILQKLYLQKN